MEAVYSSVPKIIRNNDTLYSHLLLLFVSITILCVSIQRIKEIRKSRNLRDDKY